MIPSIPRIMRRQSRRLYQNPFRTSTSAAQNDENHPHKQDFVREQFTDSETTWTNRARILSAEDFANRPRVNFSEEFQSLYDAGLVLSWIPDKQQEEIYQTYLDTMQNMHKTEKGGVTSHEYVMHVIAKKYQMKPMRIAAIVQLKHNEDQIRKQHPEVEIHHEVQEYVDQKIAEHIRNAYSEYDEVDPQAFVEAPEPFRLSADTHKITTVPDDLDLSEELYKKDVEEKVRKQDELDYRLYLEDKDEQLIDVKLDPSTRDLLQKKNEFEKSKREATMSATDPTSIEDTPPSESARPRWQYVAQIIDSTIDKRKKNKNKSKKKTHRRGAKINQLKNTIVEHNGTLRPATVAEASQTEWKVERDSLEFMYRGAKQAWLRKTLQGEVGGWGRIEAQKKVEKIEEDESNDVAVEEEEEVGDDDNNEK